ncbi:MAG: AAA family ATPase [Oscillospiraceae bacterium]|nr:AAA family ATPase [Oscillospiraceae bacterium]
MHEIQIFNHPEFGEIRTVEIDGQIYFVGIDVAKGLGYAKTRNAIRDHVDEEDKKIFNLNTALQQGDIRKTGNPNITIINESGLYSLVLASKLKKAKKFKHWVTAEVLPTIRKTGSYNPNPPQIEIKPTVYIEHVENLHIIPKKEVFLMQEKSNPTPAQKQSGKRQKIGERTHIYRNADGSIFGKKVVNKFSDGSKNAVWFLFNPETNSFHEKCGLSGKKAPLYNADVLHHNKDNTECPIVIVEGEKDVETLADMEIIATSLPNGGQSKQWHEELYNDGLQEHDIIILTDNDKTGETYGETVAKNVSRIAKSVKIIPAREIWSECPEKGDISDITEALGQEKTIERLLDASRKAAYYADISDFDELVENTSEPFSLTASALTTKKIYEFEKKPIRYVWYPYIPAGDYTVLMAAGGTGKTYFACGVAATISRGEALPVPDEYKSKKAIPQNRNVLIISAEDRGSDIGERLIKAGADANSEYIHVVDKTASNGFLFPKDSSDMQRIDIFEKTIQNCNPNLIIIDPWHAFCPPEVDVNRINHVRPIFQTISAICEKYDCGLILISHVNKKPQENANNAALGSVDLVNASRSALTVIWDGRDEMSRLVIHTKINHAAHGQTIKFTIDDNSFAWNGFEPNLTKDTLEEAAKLHRKPTDLIRDKLDDTAIKEELLELITELAEHGKETKIAYQQLEDMCDDETFSGLSTSKRKELIEQITKSEAFQSRGLTLKKYIQGISYTDKHGNKKRSRGFIVSCMVTGQEMAVAMS